MAILNNNEKIESRIKDFDDVAKVYDECSDQVAADDGKYAYLAKKRSKNVLAAALDASEAAIPAAKAVRGAGAMLDQSTTASRAFITRNQHYSTQDILTKIVDRPEYEPVVFNYGGNFDSAHSELVTEGLNLGDHQLIARVSDDGALMLGEGTTADRLREGMHTCVKRLGKTQEEEKAACDAVGRKSNKLAAYVFRIDIPDPKLLAGMNSSDSRLPYGALSVITAMAVHCYMEIPYHASLSGYGITYFAMYYHKGKLHQIVLVVIPREYHPEGINNVTLIGSNCDRYRSKKTGTYCQPDDEGAYIVRHKGDPIAMLPHSYFTRANSVLKFSPAQFCYRTTKTKLMLSDLFALMAGGNSGHYTIGRLDANPLRGNKVAFKTCMTYNHQVLEKAEAKVNLFNHNATIAVGLEKAAAATDKLVNRIRQFMADWTDNFNELFAPTADYINEDTLFCFDGDTPEHIQAITGCIEKVAHVLNDMIMSAAADLHIQMA